MNKLIIIALATVSIVGCKGGSKNPFKALATAQKSADLQGEFRTKCEAQTAKGFAQLFKALQTGHVAKYSDTTIRFAGDSVVQTETAYFEEDCKTPVYSISEIGSFKVGRPAGPGQLRDLDMTFTKVEGQVLNDEFLRAANDGGWCGRNDWKTGKSIGIKDAAGDKTCLNAEYRDGQRKWTNAYRREKRPEGEALVLGDMSKRIVESNERPSSPDSKIFLKR